MSIALALEAGPIPGDDPLIDRVAAAALDQFAEYGIRRSTINDIAARAGVSHMTIFRRFNSKQGLVAVVIAREIRLALDELDRVSESAQSLEDRLVRGLAFIVPYVRDHPLFDRLLRSEPEFLLPLLTVDGGPVLELYRSLIAQRLHAEVASGRAAPVDVDRAAEVIGRLAISLLLTRDGVITLDNRPSLVALVGEVLLPMLQPA
jgi:TetR/AcrR family transcriptional regulator, repressor for uid operon